MGTKLLWTGLTFVVAVPSLFSLAAATVVGAVLMAIGCVLLWLDR